MCAPPTVGSLCARRSVSASRPASRPRSSGNIPGAPGLGRVLIRTPPGPPELSAPRSISTASASERSASSNARRAASTIDCADRLDHLRTRSSSAAASLAILANSLGLVECDRASQSIRARFRRRRRLESLLTRSRPGSRNSVGSARSAASASPASDFHVAAELHVVDANPRPASPATSRSRYRAAIRRRASSNCPFRHWNRCRARRRQMPPARGSERRPRPAASSVSGIPRRRRGTEALRRRCSCRSASANGRSSPLRRACSAAPTSRAPGAVVHARP